MTKISLLCLLALGMLLAGCTGNTQSQNVPARNESIPASLVKITPATDIYPPILHSDEWGAPVPLGAPVNTAGAEDSPFITPDGNTLYFFFTPDPNIPVEKQLFDNVTGIWVSKKSGGKWAEPERVILQDARKLSLDGCEFVSGDTMWFCSAREGYTGIHWFSANFRGGSWHDWKNADFPADYQVGELHFTRDGREVYFHSARAGGAGGLDVWVSKNVSGQWQEPLNVAALNTVDNEGWPFVSEDGNELWLLRVYQGSPAIFRSKNVSGKWSEPELILSQFAGEPSLDNAGNIYFVHHYYKDGKMLEADIYVAYRKST